MPRSGIAVRAGRGFGAGALPGCVSAGRQNAPFWVGRGTPARSHGL